LDVFGQLPHDQCLAVIVSEHLVQNQRCHTDGAALSPELSEIEEIPEGNPAMRLQLQQRAKALGLNATHRNLGLLLIVHPKLEARLKPGNNFLDAMNVHQK
jgi:hypothetical protein